MITQTIQTPIRVRASLTAQTILFAGDFALLQAWSPPGTPTDFDVQSLSTRQLIAEAARSDSSLAAIILTCQADIATPDTTPTTLGSPLNADLTLATLTQLQKNSPNANIILLTHNGLSLDLCCAAVRLGVKHFIDTDAQGWQTRLTTLLTKPAAIDSSPKQTDPQTLLESVGIRAVSPAMQDLIVQVYRGAQVSDATVLIHGESGTGKQLLAEAIHRLDPKRSKNPFIPVNCAAITGTLAESELFGHIKGAFSGATDPRLGYFRTANKGTIFLDEISELPLSLQPKLLRVLQERRVMPVGSDKEEPIDVRVVAASNISLTEKIAKGEFRLDLYQRLNVIHLAVPPLRQRTEDIPLLVQHFIEKYAHYCTQTIREVDPQVYALLKTKAGNGNVRELENIIRQTLVFKASGTRIELADLPRHLLEDANQPGPTEFLPTNVADNLVEMIRSKRLTLRQVVETFEKTIILQAAKNSPEMTKVELAKALGLPRRTLYYKLDTEQHA